jgi:hypothetical protein
MKSIHFSNPATIILDNENTKDFAINVFIQFFIHHDKERFQEIKKCLRFNYLNQNINNIYLLNERIYSCEELGILDDTDKIVQVNITKRLKYQDVFKYITDNNIQGYNVITNSDIMLDASIANVKNTDIHLQKKMFALLRYELNTSNIKKSKLFGPRFDSQDTWIIHSNFNIQPNQQQIFNFQLGKPGCDNKMVYLMNVLGFEVINDPLFIKTYHYHLTQIRNYNHSDVITKPWGVIIPANIHYSKCPMSLGIDLPVIYLKTNKFTELQYNDNDVLFKYIQRKLEAKEHFIIPRIAGVENNYAYVGELIQINGLQPNLLESIKKMSGVMKNNAGVKISNVDSVELYSKMYMNSFKNCEIYTAWDPQGNVIPYISQSQDYIKNKYNKPCVWALALDIFHYIYNCPWTFALKGKRVLIISSFEQSIKEKISIREKIYGIDLFPDCELVTICPPQTQGIENSEEFNVEFYNFTTKLDLLDYDVALVSCGGYGNLVCDYIYTQGKSAIYVGGVLQMYFGIIGNRWMIERQDIIRLFLNENWTRPKNIEKPKGHANVENSCYW